MVYAYSERLSALDAMFLGLEDGNTHMHVGSVSIFDARALEQPAGGIDIGRIESAIEAAVSHQPRLRQRLLRTPILEHPVWVDDARFNLRYHVHHTCLPHPGDDRQLKRLAGRIMSQELDRGKPLWEMWFVEGLQNHRCAQISKIHHSLLDGAGGVDLMSGLLSTDPEAAPPTAKRWIPRSRPDGLRLLTDELLYRSAFPAKLLSSIGSAVANPNDTLSSLRDRFGGLGDLLRAAAAPASETPLNGTIGPHRRIDCLSVDLAKIKQIKRRFQVTINDVVLACVAGAMREFLRERGSNVDHLDFRVAAPVNVRNQSQQSLGNHVSSMVLPLPLDEPEATERLRRVATETARAKVANQASGMELIEEVSDRVSPQILVGIGQMVPWLRPCNVVVTNVHGPDFPLYFLGAQLREIYPMVPLLGNQALGIALLSYDGNLFWGFNCDWDEVPDAHQLVGLVEREVETLLTSAAAEADSPRARLKSPGNTRKRPLPRPQPEAKGQSRRAAAKRRRQAGPLSGRRESVTH